MTRLVGLGAESDGHVPPIAKKDKDPARGRNGGRGGVNGHEARWASCVSS